MGIYTTNYNLYKPSLGERGWGNLVNNNCDIIDTTCYILDCRYPIATIIMSGTWETPTGYLMCDGQAVSRTTYSKLFELIGTTYGNGDGSTTFNLPNFLNRTPIGGNYLNQYGGSTTSTLTIAQMPSHTHTYSATSDNPGDFHNHRAYFHQVVYGYSDTTGVNIADTVRSDMRYITYNLLNGGAHTHTISGTTTSVGSGTAHNNMSPYITVVFYIRVI